MIRRFLHFWQLQPAWKLETRIPTVQRRLGEVVQAGTCDRRRLLLKALTSGRYPVHTSEPVS